MLDDFRYWNVARTQVQIQSNYINEIDPAVEANLVIYYDFNQGVASASNAGIVVAIDKKGVDNGVVTNFALSAASSNFVAQNASIVVLPVQWQEFTVQKTGGKALLNWRTASEANTRDFIVQHSIDGFVWTPVVTVSAAGNSSTTSYYQFVHDVPAKGNNYYRIHQRDIDGRSSYSPVRSVRFEGSHFFTVLSNPVRDGRLLVRTYEPANISLFSGDGKLMMSGRYNAGVVTIDVSGYVKGVYLLKIGDQTEKVIVR